MTQLNEAKTWIFFVLIFCWGFGNETIADPFSLDNGAPLDPNQHLVSGGNKMTGWIQAEDFTLTGTGSWTLNALNFWAIGDAQVYQGGYSGQILWRIYSNSDNKPGGILHEGIGLVAENGFGPTGRTVNGLSEFYVSLSLNVAILEAGTYWLGLHNGPLDNTSIDNMFSWESTLGGVGTLDSQQYLLSDLVTQQGTIPGSVLGWHQQTNVVEHAFNLQGDYDQKIAPVPEPSSLLLLGSGLAGLIAWRKKRQ